MTDFFVAPDAENEPTLWVEATGDDVGLAIIRRCDLGPMAHHWDEIVARVTDGNLTAQQRWALDKAARG